MEEAESVRSGNAFGGAVGEARRWSATETSGVANWAAFRRTLVNEASLPGGTDRVSPETGGSSMSLRAWLRRGTTE
jgi:hypothetical protein